MKQQVQEPGAAIKTLREMANLTLKEVANGADTSISYLSKVETGSLAPSHTYVSRVAAFIATQLGKAA